MPSFSDLGIQTQELEVGAVYGFTETAGTLDARPITVRVIPKLLNNATFTLLWQPSGDVFEDFTQSVTIPAGERVTVELPYVDQAGFRWGNQAVTGWYYQVEVSAGGKTRVYTHAPRLSMNTPRVDVDALALGQTVSQAAYTPAPYVIYGNTGTTAPVGDWVTQTQLSQALALKVNSTTYTPAIASKLNSADLDPMSAALVNNSGSQLRAAILALIGSGTTVTPSFVAAPKTGDADALTVTYTGDYVSSDVDAVAFPIDAVNSSTSSTDPTAITVTY